MAHLPPPQLYHMLGLGATGDLGPYTFYTKANGKLVWFLKAPPTSPPTFHQLRNQACFTTAADLWKMLPDFLKANWKLAAKKARLRMGGYALWTYYFISGDKAAIKTIEHQTNLELL